MFNKNKLKSIVLESTSLKILNQKGETIVIGIETVDKVRLNLIKPTIYILLLHCLLAVFITLVIYYLFNNVLFTLIAFLLLSYFFFNKILFHKKYNLIFSLKDEPLYSIAIPNIMKDEIKTVIWDIRRIILEKQFLV